MPNIKTIHLNFVIWHLFVILILIFSIFLTQMEVYKSLVHSLASFQITQFGEHTGGQNDSCGFRTETSGSQRNLPNSLLFCGFDLRI
jgi:hypothetical protein